MIPYSRQSINSKDILEVKKVLKSNFLTQGKNVEIFEKLITQISNAKYGVAVNSASSALHLACIALGIKKGDRVWTVPNTFVASANCAINCGAIVDFVDIDKNTWNISIEELEKKLAVSKKKKKLPKLLIPVHFAGQPTEQKKIWELSKKYKFKILQDASHGLGAKYKKKYLGNHKDIITIFSFHPVKMITTGEGGSAHTDNKKYFNLMKSICSHGIVRKKNNLNKGINHLLYDQKYLGFNYRLTDIQASLGVSQLKKLSIFIKKRREIAKIYNKYLDKSKLSLPAEKEYAKSSFHLYVVLLKNNKKDLRNKLIHYLKKQGIYTNIHYKPIHLQTYYKKLGFKKNDFKNAEFYYERALSLPIHPNLKKKELMLIIKKINNFFR